MQVDSQPSGANGLVKLLSTVSGVLVIFILAIGVSYRSYTAEGIPSSPARSQTSPSPVLLQTRTLGVHSTGSARTYFLVESEEKKLELFRSKAAEQHELILALGSSPWLGPIIEEDLILVIGTPAQASEALKVISEDMARRGADSGLASSMILDLRPQ